MRNKFSKVLAGLLLLFAVNAAKAQNVVNRIELPKQQPDTVVAKPVIIYKEEKADYVKQTYAQQRGMISRDAAKTVFIPKGQWMLGGQVAWNQWNNDNLNYLVLKDINFEGYTFSAGPYFGYFFANNMAVGARFSYKRYYINLGEFDLNLGDDFNIGLKDLYYLQHNYENTVFMRSYLPIGTSNIFGLFGEFQLNYTFSEGKNSTGRDETFTGVYEKVHNLEIGIAGGMAVFLTGKGTHRHRKNRRMHRHGL